MRRTTTAQFTRRAAATAVTGVAAAALLTGCGTTPAGGGSPERPAPISATSPRSCPGSGSGPDGGQAPPTVIDGTPANTPEAAALSQAVGEQGRGAFADVYSTQITDAPPGRVTLCVTDLARGRLLLEAAHRADPRADPARADLYLSRYTHGALADAAQRIVRLRGAEPVYAAAPAGDASGVTVFTSAEGLASADFRSRLERVAGGGIPVTLTLGDAPQGAGADAPSDAMSHAPR
ncbi:hypothetical protein ABT084_26115 [Streptomyces sp. NPDC002138]|uniref:hypothetical protein n=1 Tax=Streptomyces sp. NPDC002138 TaxID=3154410 RepID=UPI00331CA537